MIHFVPADSISDRTFPARSRFGVAGEREIALLFTRTIRRKMVFGLALVLVMLVILSLSGLSGLLSYRQTVRDLDFSINQVPRRGELTSALGALFEPLLLTAPRYRQSAFAEALRKTRTDVARYRRKLDRLPPKPGVNARRQVAEPLLTEIDEGLDRLETLQAGLGDQRTVSRTTRQILEEVARLHVIAHGIPDSQVGLNDTLAHASRAYHSRLAWVLGTSAVVVLLFFGLVRYGYTHIFAPLRVLHQGALRVAQGDFDYRLRLRTNDEMAELADSFNRMTDRFQEIASDLDRQVQVRGKQLVRSERLAGIGFLAAGVAHEINNPLSAIAMAAESLEGRLSEICPDADADERELVREYLGMIQSEAFRCQQITARLLDFARGQEATRSRHDLTQLIAEVLAMVQHMSKYRDRRIQFAHNKPCYAEVNGTEIKQVVLNLVANALEAMDAGGTLRIGIVERVDEVVLTFEDDGCGMTPEVIEHLFEPFYTRRKDGKGTGLGMAISHRIICDHGGTIEADSEGPNRGSTFRIHLPRRAANSAAA